MAHPPAPRPLPLALAAALAAGCGGGSAPPPLPADWVPQVTGRVVLKGKPDLGGRLDGGKVWLRSVADPSHESVGVIDADGTFALATHGDQSRAGLPAGEYQVRVEPRLDTREDVRAAPFHRKYLEYQTSGLRVRIPPQGELTLELDPARK